MPTKFISPYPIPVDDFFDNQEIRQMMSPGKVFPRLAVSSLGGPVVLFLVREKDDFIKQLTHPRFGLKYGQFIVDRARVLKLMLLVLASETNPELCLAEMAFNWQCQNSREILTALASAKPVFVQFYGEDWKCKKTMGFPVEPGLAAFILAFQEIAKVCPVWSEPEFTLACQLIDHRYEQEDQWLVELPAQMNSFAQTGALPDRQIWDDDPHMPPESAEIRHARHNEFIQSQYLQLAAFAWDGYQEKGRGILLIMKNCGGNQLTYLGADEIHLAVGSAPLPKVSKYDPETEIVVTINDHGRRSSSYVVTMPSLPPPVAFRKVTES